MNQTITCPTCGSEELVSIAFQAGDAEVVFRTCAPCEAKWWERDGSPIPLRSAIDIVTGA